MEKHVKTIYYIGIQTEAEADRVKAEEAGRGKNRERRKRTVFFRYRLFKRHRREEEVLPVYKQTRLFSYEGGLLQIYFSFLPRELISSEQPKEKKRFFSCLSRAFEKAQMFLYEDGEENIIFSKELCSLLSEKQQLPMVLYAVLFKQARERAGKAAETITISLPEDAGPILEESVLTLLLPYLSRTNFVVFFCEETENTGRIERFLYEEYGILAVYSKRPEKNTIWIDLRQQEKAQFERYASENKIYHLNYDEVLKFLDTTVKNGYNTKVN